MTEQECNLLAVDLNERTQYGVIIKTPDGDFKLEYVDSYWEVKADDGKNHTYPLDEVRPYLRPMSSMTREEMAQMKADTCPFGTGTFDSQYLCCPMNHFGEMISYTFMHDILVWLRKHHFDFMGLIEKGLALEAPEMMYVIPLETPKTN